MSGKRYSPEEIISKLREAEVFLAQGVKVDEVIRRLTNWWSNQHFDRIDGVEQTSPSPWVPKSKPIIFNELGCPAIDKGANQPNVFYDPRSSESATPHFSSGTRDDSMQRAALDVTLDFWQDPENNPVSSSGEFRMVDPNASTLWTWDARPYPYFPQLTDVWSDGGNWRYGHWLTGRLGGLPVGALISSIVAEFTGLLVDTSEIHQIIDGYVVSERLSARQALETLLELYGVDIVERNGILKAIGRTRLPSSILSADDFVIIENQAESVSLREQEADLPTILSLSYQDIDSDFQGVTCSTRRLVGQSRRAKDIRLPIVASYDRILPVVENRLQAEWLERNRVSFAVSSRHLDLEVGDIIDLPLNGLNRRLMIAQIDDANERRIETFEIAGNNRPVSSVEVAQRSVPQVVVPTIGPPELRVMDLPVFSGDTLGLGVKVAVSAVPWPGGVPVLLSASESGFQERQTLTRPATIGSLQSELSVGPVGVFDYGNKIDVELNRMALESVDEQLLFSGRNALAVQSRSGAFEVLQFKNAELISENLWRLSCLLRAQLGTDDAMISGFDGGAEVAILNGAVEELNVNRSETEQAFFLRAGLSGFPLVDQFASTDEYTSSKRGPLPLSPVHVRAKRDEATGDIDITWIRRTRIDGELFESVDVPLGEESEHYAVSILANGVVVRDVETETSSLLYGQADQLNDFGNTSTSLELSISQISQSVGRGMPRNVVIPL